MTTTRYHLKKDGSGPGVCRASVNCPIGRETPHFDTEQDARKFFEKQNQGALQDGLRGSHRSRIGSAPTAASLGMTQEDFDGYVRNRADEVAEWEGWLSKSRIPHPWEELSEEERAGLRVPVPDAEPVSVLRTGSMTPGKYTGRSSFDFAFADKERPAGRCPRTGSLFASPDDAGLRRWQNANARAFSGAVEDTVHEVTVDPNSTYVYSIAAWDDCAWYGAPHRHYWNSGILLSRFPEAARKYGWDTSTWEVVFGPDSVLAARSKTSR